MIFGKTTTSLRFRRGGHGIGTTSIEPAGTIVVLMRSAGAMKWKPAKKAKWDPVNTRWHILGEWQWHWSANTLMEDERDWGKIRLLSPLELLAMEDVEVPEKISDFTGLGGKKSWYVI